MPWVVVDLSALKGPQPGDPPIKKCHQRGPVSRVHERRPVYGKYRYTTAVKNRD